MNTTATTSRNGHGSRLQYVATFQLHDQHFSSLAAGKASINWDLTNTSTFLLLPVSEKFSYKLSVASFCSWHHVSVCCQNKQSSVNKFSVHSDENRLHPTMLAFLFYLVLLQK